MATCIVCQSSIPRGQRFKSPRYKNLAFCSEGCYNQYLTSKQQPKPPSSLDKLKSYINDLWQGQVNWPFMMRQIKNLKEEYGVDDNGIRMMLKYAIEIEGECVDLEYGIGQFIPKFIEPCMKFVEQIKRAKELAEDMEDEEVVVRKVSKQVKKVKEEEWD